MKKPYQDRQASVAAGIAIGTGVSFLVSVVGVAIGAWLIHSESVAAVRMDLLAAIIGFVASAVGAWVSILAIGRKRLLVGVGTGLCYLALLFATTAMFFGGQYQDVWKGSLAALAGSLVPSLLYVRGGVRLQKRFMKKAYR